MPIRTPAVAGLVLALAVVSSPPVAGQVHVFGGSSLPTYSDPYPLNSPTASPATPGTAYAGEPEPAPPYPPRPSASSPPRRMPPPPYYPPPPPVVAEPPPLSPVARAVYAPFYVAGLVVRYGFYYLVVAPIEVFNRTVAYGASGGVEWQRREAEDR